MALQPKSSPYLPLVYLWCAKYYINKQLRGITIIDLELANIYRVVKILEI